jgi:hypothetical protein
MQCFNENSGQIKNKSPVFGLYIFYTLVIAE